MDKWKKHIDKELEWLFELSDDSKCKCVERYDWCKRLCKKMCYLKYGWCNVHYQWYLFKLNPTFLT